MEYAEKALGKTKVIMIMRKSLLLVIIFNVFVLACSDAHKNQALLPSDAVILAFGDSLTFGTGAGKGEDYPALLSNFTNMQVINAGVPGEISSMGLERLPSLLEEHMPDLLILTHGGNDILRKLPREQQKNNLLTMIELAQTRNIQVVLLGIPEPGLFLSSAEIYEQIGEEKNIPTELTLLPDILGEKALKSDIAHPNAKGYQQMAEGIYEFLKDSGYL